MENRSNSDSPEQTTPVPRRLNVVIHGLWGIETNQDGIRLTTPPVHNHVIRAGKVGEPEIDLVDHGKQRSYLLAGVVSGKTQDFQPNKVFRVGPQHSAQLGKVAVEIQLPYPAEIRSVREFVTGGQKFFEGDVNTPPESGTVVQVLIYEIDSKNALELKPSAWKPGTDAIVNLHLYAQPPMIPADPAVHVREGFAALANAYGIKAIPLKEVVLADAQDPGIEGLKDTDIMALFELTGVVVSPPTCDMFIFDNT